MILKRAYYNKVTFFQGWWVRRYLRKMTGDQLFQRFRLFKTVWSKDLYLYSQRLRRFPVYSGDCDFLIKWYGREASKAEKVQNLCPTNAILISEQSIVINYSRCIACDLCSDFLPDQLLTKGRFNFEGEDDNDHRRNSQDRVIMQ